MKIRTGFVSNSSSSSFAIVISKEKHDKIMEQLHPFIQACINALGVNKETMDGKEYVQFGEWQGMGGSQFEYIEIEYDGEEPDGVDKYETIDNYTKKADELFGKDSYIGVSISDGG